MIDKAKALAGLGYDGKWDGKWVLHPDQIAAGNEIFTPARQSTTTPS
jgi:citrate lyase subunit beta/citryl-CoA lyase